MRHVGSRGLMPAGRAGENQHIGFEQRKNAARPNTTAERTSPTGRLMARPGWLGSGWARKIYLQAIFLPVVIVVYASRIPTEVLMKKGL
jgi:hypothetical protein